MQEKHPPISPSSAFFVKQMVLKLHQVWLEMLHLSVEASLSLKQGAGNCLKPGNMIGLFRSS